MHSPDPSNPAVTLPVALAVTIAAAKRKSDHAKAARTIQRIRQNQKPRLLHRGSRQVQFRLLADSAVDVRMRLAHSKLRSIPAVPHRRWGLALPTRQTADLEFRPWGYSSCEY